MGQEDYEDPFADLFKTHFVEPREDPISKFQRDINQLYGCMQLLCDTEFEEEFGKVLSQFISKVRNLLQRRNKNIYKTSKKSRTINIMSKAKFNSTQRTFIAKIVKLAKIVNQSINFVSKSIKILLSHATFDLTPHHTNSDIMYCTVSW